MDDADLKKAFAEVLEATQEAIGLVTSALVKQLDAQKLATDLRGQLQAAQASRLASPVAVRLAMHALAAADAEILRRNPSQH